MKKMSRTEAGRLGGLASIAGTKKRCREMREKYYQDPKICKNDLCQSIIPFEKRKTNIFCSSSCAATFNNKKKAESRTKIIRICQHPTCNNPIKCNLNTFFCSRKCYNDNQRLERFKRVEDGNAREWTVKEYLLYHHGNVCSGCDITSWQGKELKMDLDHIDGNPDNNTLENCRLLCPNCHRQTPTYKGGNSKGKNNKNDQRNIRRRAIYKKQTGAL